MAEFINNHNDLSSVDLFNIKNIGPDWKKIIFQIGAEEKYISNIKNENTEIYFTIFQAILKYFNDYNKWVLKLSDDRVWFLSNKVKSLSILNNVLPHELLKTDNLKSLFRQHKVSRLNYFGYIIMDSSELKEYGRELIILPIAERFNKLLIINTSIPCIISFTNHYEIVLESKNSEFLKSLIGLNQDKEINIKQFL